MSTMLHTYIYIIFVQKNMALKVKLKKSLLIKKNVDLIKQKGFLKKALILMHVRKDVKSEILNKTANADTRNL